MLQEKPLKKMHKKNKKGIAEQLVISFFFVSIIYLIIHVAYSDIIYNALNIINMVTIEQKDMYFTSPAFVGSSQARDQVGDLLEGVLSYSGSDLDKYIDDRFDSAVAACKQYK